MHSGEALPPSPLPPRLALYDAADVPPMGERLLEVARALEAELARASSVVHLLVLCSLASLAQQQPGVLALLLLGLAMRVALAKHTLVL